MSKKTLFCKSSCGSRLYLTAPLLQGLTANGWQLFFDGATYQRYRDFLTFFPGIREAEREAGEDEPQLWLVDRLQREKWPERILPVPVSAHPAGGYATPPPEEVLDRLWRVTAPEAPLLGKKVLITAGPTVEDIDPVRYFSNRSTGRMGIALTRAAYRLGATATLILGPTTVRAPAYAEVVRVRGAGEMLRRVREHFDACDYFIAAAAVADFTPVTRHGQKIKKTDGPMMLELKRTEDILKNMARVKKSGQKVIGFSVETENMLENSREKLRQKNLDMIVANNPREEGAGFATETNKVMLITAGGVVELGLLSKLDTAHRILQKAWEL